MRTHEIKGSIVFTRRTLGAQVLAAGLMLTACSDTSLRMVVDPDLEAMEADAMMFGGETTLFDGTGVREFVVSADTFLIFRDSTVVYLRGNVTLTAYNEDVGTPRAIVTSDRGRLDTDSNEMLAEGNAILLIQTDGRRIESYQLYYTPEDDEMRSDSATVMYDGDSVIEGMSFRSDLNFENVIIRNGRTRGGAVNF